MARLMQVYQTVWTEEQLDALIADAREQGRREVVELACKAASGSRGAILDAVECAGWDLAAKLEREAEPPTPGWQAKVRQFHAKFGVPIGSSPELREHSLRAALISEECGETLTAIERGDLPDAVDGLVDIIYVCLGAAVTWGVDLAPVFELVHAANMAKTGGPVRPDGKILKPEGWRPPDVLGEIERQALAQAKPAGGAG